MDSSLEVSRGLSRLVIPPGLSYPLQCRSPCRVVTFQYFGLRINSQTRQNHAAHSVLVLGMFYRTLPVPVGGGADIDE